MPSAHKEGIDSSQWVKIDDVFKVKRTRKGNNRTHKPHDIEKWFKVWEILFPDEPKPSNPCEYPPLDERFS